MPTFWEDNATQLRAIGYESSSPALPLSQITPLTSIATVKEPVYCGTAEIVARGVGHRALCVIRAASRAAYYGNLNYDLFFLGDELREGHLWAAENFFVMAPARDVPLDVLQSRMRDIPVSRSLVTKAVHDRSGNASEVQVYRDETAPAAPIPVGVPGNLHLVFVNALRREIVTSGAKRALKLCDQMVRGAPADQFRFVRTARDFALHIALTQIATNYARRHGRVKPTVETEALLRWLSGEMKHVPEAERHHLSRSIVLAADLLTYHRFTAERFATNPDLQALIASDAATMFGNLAHSVLLDQRLRIAALPFLRRKLEQFRSSGPNTPWEKDVLPRIQGLLDGTAAS